MSGFYISKDGRTASFSDMTQFLGVVDALLQLREHPMVSIPRHEAGVFQSVKELFKKHGIQPVLTVDSEPAAIDYVIHSLLGGVAGGAAGAATSVGVALAAAQVGQRIPYVGLVIAIGSLIGVAIGVTAGLALTRMGLRVKFSPVDPEMVDVEFLPAAA